MPNERLLQKKGQTDGRTDRRHIPRVEVSLDGIPTTGLREEVSRLVAATCQKSWVGYALRKRATQTCLMSVYFRKKDGRTDRQTDRQTDAINPAWGSP